MMVPWRDICGDYRAVKVTRQHLFASLISLSLLHIVHVWRGWFIDDTNPKPYFSNLGLEFYAMQILC